MTARSNEVQRVALVTGGGSGIGQSTARLLASRGWAVVVTGRDEARLRATIDGLEGGPGSYVVADMSTTAAAEHVVETVRGRHGRLDVLVCAHGVLGTMKPLTELTDADVTEALAINLVGPVVAAAAAAPLLSESRGSIVNVASINALQAEPEAVPYGVSKSGLIGFTRYAAVELAAVGVRVNAVLPGWVRTPMTEYLFGSPEFEGRPISANLMQRPAHPDEIAQVIAFLASEEAGFMTGSNVVADGGQVVRLADLTPA
ncbi:SDR family oxidoreductase [Nocardioides sp. C4-1]|uniref:SDR family NAD(P)-dependent oxidoreductase n=1 Tax=Nocardioides sp. C4-1 TaxID=3151851 RepID=UPI003263B042